jgi:subtilisin family serine protease
MKCLTLAAVLLVLYGCSTVPPHAEHADSELQIVVTIRDLKPVLRTSPGSTARVYSSSQSYRRTAYAQRVIAGLARDYQLDQVADWRIDLLDVHCAIFQTHSDAERDALITRLTQDSRVESVQPMNTFRTHSGVGDYNDPYFRLQKGVETMRVPEAHQWSRGRGVSVAVIDTGVDVLHPELAGRIRGARNFVDSDTRQFRADRHGTAVAGVIAALTDNSTGIIGVAPASQLLALKACWQLLAERSAVCSTLTLAEAISFAVNQRVNVINLSLGGPSDPLLARLLREAMKRGIVVVGARASNANASRGFPLNVDGVIAVADADEPDAPDARGPNERGDERQTLLAAPGREVLTLVPGQRYDYVSGSSISTALVSGVVALLLEHRRALSVSAVRSLLERTARSPERRPFRLVNACDAVAALVHAPACAAADDTRSLAGVGSAPPLH